MVGEFWKEYKKGARDEPLEEIFHEIVGSLIKNGVFSDATLPKKFKKIFNLRKGTFKVLLLKTGVFCSQTFSSLNILDP